MTSPKAAAAKFTPDDVDSSSSGTSKTVTTKTIMGKPFSVERYYMLSEIEQQALLPVYLNDYSYEWRPDTSANESESSSNTTAQTTVSEADCELPPYVILYLLWHCDDDDKVNENSKTKKSAKAIAQDYKRGPLEGALRKLQSLSKRINQARDGETEGNPDINLPPNVYVVVDMLIWSSEGGSGDEGDENTNNGKQEEVENDRLKKERFEKHLATAEALAQTILLPINDDDETELESVRLSGATIGLADHSRAAPGLESCLEAIVLGRRDRRRFVSGILGIPTAQGAAAKTDTTDNANPNNVHKSCVGIVSHSLQDLVGYDEESETDAVQGVIQSLTHASFVTEQAARSATSATETEEKRDHQLKNERSGTQSLPPLVSTTPYQPPILDYAQKAHVYWRVHKAGLSPEPTPEEIKVNEAPMKNNQHDNLVWFMGMLMFLFAFWWNSETEEMN